MTDKNNVFLLCSHRKGNLGLGETGEISLTIDENLGDLQLGKISQEFISDPDLRKILESFDLDTNMMNHLQDQELLLVTSVVYSERFEVQGNRQQKVVTLYCCLFLFGANIFIFVDLIFLFRLNLIPWVYSPRRPRGRGSFRLTFPLCAFLFWLSVFRQHKM